MIYFKAEDEYWYSEDGKKELLKKYNLSTNLLFAKSEKQIMKIYEDGLVAQTSFIGPYLPKQISPLFRDIFDVIHIENKYGILTTEQFKRGISPVDVLKNKLDVKVSKPSLTFENYAINEENLELKLMIDRLKNIEARKMCGIVSKGFFLTGVPGTGKTYFAKCLAGELDRSLVELNLSVFINAADTFGLLEQFFSFFATSKGKYILLIDEIEKMFNDSGKARQVLGYLLTMLNEYHSRDENGSDVLFIATANDVTELVSKHPELFRKGRFDASIYLTAPDKDKALITVETYVEQCRDIFQKEMIKGFVYMAATDRENTFYKIKSDTVAFKIIQVIKEQNFYEKLVSFAKDTDEEKIKNFWTQANSMDELNDFLQDMTEKYKFNLDVKSFVNIGFAKWRKSLKTSRDEFPYVPAEIADMVLEIFSDYYFEGTNVNLENYIEANVPVQIALVDGILRMNAATINFKKM